MIRRFRSLFARRPHKALTLAHWHGATRFCSTCDCIHISFDTWDGEVLRLRLDRLSAGFLAATLSAELQGTSPGQCRPCQTHSESSSGSPIVEVSTKAELEKQ